MLKKDWCFLFFSLIPLETLNDLCSLGNLLETGVESFCFQSSPTFSFNPNGNTVLSFNIQCFSLASLKRLDVPSIGSRLFYPTLPLPSSFSKILILNLDPLHKPPLKCAANFLHDDELLLKLSLMEDK